MSKETSTKNKKSETEETTKLDKTEVITPTEIVISKHNDIKVGFAFALEDADGKQIQLSDTLTFKCALEPGMINSIVRRIEGTLKELGQDYFMTLVRDYISKKQEEIYKAEALKSYNSIYTQEDSKIVASGVRDIIGDSFEQTANDNNPLTADEMPVE